MHAWSKEIIDFAIKNAISYTDFDKKQATRKNVEKYLKARKPNFVIFNGHGPIDSTAILGHNDEALIETGKNTDLLKDTIVYARACCSSKILGREIISKNNKNAFIGYSNLFSWIHSADRECNPYKDKIAEPFKLVSNEIPMSILKGHTTYEAHERAQELCMKLIQEYSATGNEELDKETRFWLFVDMTIQEHRGNPEARFQ
ncbi:MAG: hypothetical protein ABIF85_04215 [Nanoarchaeota archaeon]|nr:hypothetical protein [Nanoarchaeota archaeon]MBU4452159.1 hypothetical protein [Nanoarchaeota archaeon]MCG2724199.1 hypothetical protein [archaeon]